MKKSRFRSRGHRPIAGVLSRVMHAHGAHGVPPQHALAADNDLKLVLLVEVREDDRAGILLHEESLRRAFIRMRGLRRRGDEIALPVAGAIGKRQMAPVIARGFERSDTDHGAKDR